MPLKLSKIKAGKGPNIVGLSKKELWTVYGYNRPAKPRYEGLKGIYWYVVSLYVRTRDTTLWKRCISCNKYADSIDALQAGHYIAAGTGGMALLFDLRNINGECGYCNGFDGNHLIGYARGLDERYGPGTAQKLENEYMRSRMVGAPTPKKWSDADYDREIRRLQGELANL